MTLYLLKFLLAALLINFSVSIRNPCRENPDKQFMPHPESANKFIQCTKRGEMFVFNCQQPHFVWNDQTNKCEKPKAAAVAAVERMEPKMVFFKSKSKNLGQKLKFLSSQLNTDSDENEPSMDIPEATTTTITTTTTTTPMPSPFDYEDDFIISKVKNLNEQEKSKTIVSFHTSTEATETTTASTTTTTSTSTITTTSTLTTTSTEATSTTTLETTTITTALETNSTDSLEKSGDNEDTLIIATILQNKIEDASSRREQELLRQQLEKQEFLIKQGKEIEDEIVRQHLIENESKLKQQIDDQKEMLKEKLSNSNLENSAELSIFDIQKLIHDQDMAEQRHQLELQNLEHQKHIEEMKLLEKQQLEDQAILQALFNFNHLEKHNTF